MANHLKMADVQAILALVACGRSYRRISRDPRVDHQTGGNQRRFAISSILLPRGNSSKAVERFSPSRCQAALGPQANGAGEWANGPMRECSLIGGRL
jgi:hypothetical protein